MSCGVVTEFIKTHPLTPGNVLEDVSINYRGAGIHVKEVVLKEGMEVIKHSHPYDHLSILVYGSVTVTTDDFKMDLEGPTSIVIRANLNHAVMAHSDSLWMCIHPDGVL
jgi:quercetin dioxygenase-like cupin family protein